MFGFFRRSAPVAPVPPKAVGKSKVGSRLKGSAAAAALCCTLIGGFEGLRTSAYPDPAAGREPWTVCYGDTEGVKLGDRYTGGRVQGDARQVARKVRRAAVVVYMAIVIGGNALNDRLGPGKSTFHERIPAARPKPPSA